MKNVFGACLLAMMPALIAGCASTAPEVTRSNSHVQMPHYSFVVPPDHGWRVQRFDNPDESAIITQRIGPFHFEMKIMRNLVADDALRQATAKAVADDFRQLEQRIMIEQGVNRGLYRLENVSLGEETIAGLTFYTMDYVVAGDSSTQRAALYLWFPKPERNESFIVALYSETIPPDSVLLKSYLPDFKSTLQTLTLR